MCQIFYLFIRCNRFWSVSSVYQTTIICIVPTTTTTTTTAQLHIKDLESRCLRVRIVLCWQPFPKTFVRYRLRKFIKRLCCANLIDTRGVVALKIKIQNCSFISGFEDRPHVSMRKKELSPPPGRLHFCIFYHKTPNIKKVLHFGVMVRTWRLSVVSQRPTRRPIVLTLCQN